MNERERERIEKAIDFAKVELRGRFYKYAAQALSDNPPSAALENVLWENAGLLVWHLVDMLEKVVEKEKGDE